jgi:hypothetical protein
MRRLWSLLLLLCLPAAAHASWAHVPLETLVQGSDIVVVGTLVDVSEHTAGQADYGQGHIVVREVIWGQVRPGDALLLKWQNASAVVCPRVEHRGAAGEEGVWLLTAEDGHVEANYPGRFVGLSERRQVERALARFPVVLRGGAYFVEAGDPLAFAVVYRNFSDAPRAFPGVEFAEGQLNLSPGSRLLVESELSGMSRPRTSLRLSLARRLAPVTVPARGERRVEVNLRDLLDKQPVSGESLDVRLTLRGLPPTNEVGFYLGRPLFPTPVGAPAAAGQPSKAGFFYAPAARRGLPPHRRALLTFVVAFSLYLLLKKYRAR